MNRIKRSVVWKIEKVDLQILVDKSSSLGEVLNFLGLQSKTGSNRTTLNRRLLDDSIDMKKFEVNRKTSCDERIKNLNRGKRIPDNEMFKDQSKCTRSAIRCRILTDRLIKYECSDCGNNGFHNNKKLVLQLDHINGVNNDHRLNNLRFLCPNCHTQTTTYSNKRKTARTSCACGNFMHKKSKMCKECSDKKFGDINHKSKIIWPDFEFLSKRLWEVPTTKISKELGVSDVAISKHIKKLGLSKPPRGYWAKLKCQV